MCVCMCGVLYGCTEGWVTAHLQHVCDVECGYVIVDHDIIPIYWCVEGMCKWIGVYVYAREHQNLLSKQYKIGKSNQT